MESKRRKVVPSKQHSVASPPGLSFETLDEYRNDFKADDKNLLALNFMTQHKNLQATDRDAVIQSDHLFSHKIPTDGKPITSQRASGRCWLFAALNVMRLEVMSKYKLDTFEFSQAHLFFYDKLERCNFFLDAIIRTREEDLDGRLVQHLLHTPIMDGGQYEMLINLVEKYGVMPKSAFPDSETCIASRPFNAIIKHKLRQFAHELRELHQAGNSIDVLRVASEKMMKTVYCMLTIHLGLPPESFDWRFHCKGKKELQMHRNITPADFYEKHVDFDVTSQVSLVNDPRNEYNKLFTVQFLGNMVEGRGARYVNAPIDALEHYVRVMVAERQKPVWFGCDFRHSVQKKMGIMDPKLVNNKLLYGTEVSTLDKEQRLRYGSSLMTHAMVFTGIDIQDDVVVSYRVENSHGKDKGKDGYLCMTAEWFKEFVYQVVVPKDILTKELQAVLEQEPSALPPWDPMGNLAL